VDIGPHIFKHLIGYVLTISILDAKQVGKHEGFLLKARQTREPHGSRKY
jgi:hypothetical protein